MSTDSARYAELARGFGAETPFLRPPEISGDLATDYQCFDHALRWLEEREGYRPDLVVHLRPTHPNRRPEDIRGAIELLAAHPEWDSVRSVAPAPETPFKMWFAAAEGELNPVVRSSIPEAHSKPRQSLPRVYLQNAAIDVIRQRTIRELRSMAGRRIGGYIMAESHDIDTLEHLQTASLFFELQAGLPVGKTFSFDIDGVIATRTPGNDYALAEPIAATIRCINRLHRAGNRIVLHTARGSLTGKDWGEVTRCQMADWGVCYDELRFGKPAADYYVDDRNLSLESLCRLINESGAAALGKAPDCKS